jgi:SAM-dependent methyltransferase
MSSQSGNQSGATPAETGKACGPGGSLNSDYWQARYVEGTTGWDRGKPSPVLTAWLTSGALTPCRILVPGCGRGHEVVVLAQAGFDVVAVDYAPSAVAAVREALDAEGVRAEVVQSDLFAYQPDTPFDAVYEQTCLCALPPERWGCYEKRLATWLNSGGSLVAAFMQTESDSGPPFACPPDAMRKLFAADHWEWPECLEPVSHPNGLTELTGIVRRR